MIECFQLISQLGQIYVLINDYVTSTIHSALYIKL